MYSEIKGLPLESLQDTFIFPNESDGFDYYLHIILGDDLNDLLVPHAGQVAPFVVTFTKHMPTSWYGWRPFRSKSPTLNVFEI